MGKQSLFLTFLMVVFVFWGVGSVNGGSLNPTSAPSSDGTMKTLSEVEPRIAINSQNTPGDADYEYIIDSAGSYYLTGNVVTIKSGIKIESSNVMVDLCGYKLAHTGTASATGVRIIDCNDFEIRDGAIVNFYAGVYNSNFDNYNNRIVSVSVTNNKGYGILLRGKSNVVKNCEIRGNGNEGFYSAACGVQTGDNSIVLSNTICDNGHGCPYYVYGIKAGESSIVSDNIISNNGHNALNYVYGIYASEACVVSGNVCRDNGKDAIGSGERLYGIYARSCSVVKNNSVLSTGTDAEGFAYGILTSSNCVVSNNTAYLNKSNNIILGSGSVDDNNCAPALTE